MKQYLLTSLMICGFTTVAYAQVDECSDTTTSVDPASVVQNVNTACCSKTKTRKQNRCLNKARRAINRTDEVLTDEFVATTVGLIDALRSGGCDISGVTLPACSNENSISTDEAGNNISEDACDRKQQSKRQKRLRQRRKNTNSAKSYLGTDFVNVVKDEVKTLRQSAQCGQGGEKSQNSCGRIVNPRDGAIVGNVYKLSDHGGRPVFITHNGARSGKAITQDGTLIERLNYTGLANPDAQGRRHHYRMTRDCRSLPKGFLLQIGSTCYEINSPCARID